MLGLLSRAPLFPPNACSNPRHPHQSRVGPPRSQVFQFCKFLKVFGNIIILVVVGLVGLSYYPIVVSLYGPQLVSQDEPAGERAAAFFVVILFHLFGGLMLWSYFACILTDPGRVPSDFQPDVEDESALHEARLAPLLVVQLVVAVVMLVVPRRRPNSTQASPPARGAGGKAKGRQQ